MIELVDLSGAYELRGKKIEQLKYQVDQRDIAINTLQAENMNLRDDYSLIAKERADMGAVVENQKYQLGKYAEEIARMQEEIEALKYFAKRYLEV